MRGSRPGFGYQSGTFCVTLDNQYNSQGWPINASLSFKPIYKATSTTYAFRCGSSSASFDCGFAFVLLYRSSNITSWGTGAAISFKSLLFIVIIFIKLQQLIMFVVVVTATMVFIVVSLMFFSGLHFLLLSGMLVLLYHLNLVYKATSTTYAYRGGRCDNGFYCGFVCIYLAVSFSGSNWVLGAALSFKSYEIFYCDYFHQNTTTHYALRGGGSANGVNCGTFYITIDSFSTSNYRIFGASLSFK